MAETYFYKKTSPRIEAWPWTGQADHPEWLGPLAVMLPHLEKGEWFFVRQPNLDRPAVMTRRDF